MVFVVNYLYESFQLYKCRLCRVESAQCISTWKKTFLVVIEIYKLQNAVIIIVFFVVKYSEVWLDKCRLCAAKKKDNYRREEGKGHRCWLGDIIEYRTNHLAVKMIWWKVVGRTTTLGGWYFGLVWTCWSAIFSIHPLRQVANILFILFFKSSWCKIASAARKRNWFQFRSLSSSDDLLPFLLYLSFY